MKNKIKTLLTMPLLTILIMAFSLSACNADIGFGSYSFHYVHIQMYAMTESIHLHVITWKGDEGGIELKVTYNGKETTLLLGDGTYMLYDVEECPICGSVEYK